MLGDAAACPVQWVYSEAELASLAAGRPGLEFFDPPQCPFFEYPLGVPSPYFEQAAALLGSLVEVGKMDCEHYAAATFKTFGPGFPGYRDRSLKAFLRRYVAGLLPPATGTPDEQANCFARLSPLVALYAGAPLDVLAAAAERMIRVTQHGALAVAYGTAAALMLNGVIGDASVAAAVAATVDWLEQRQQQEQERMEINPAADMQPAAEAEAEALTAELWGAVAAALLQAAEAAPLAPLTAAARLGRNCHLPNCLQTPLQVLLHLEHHGWQPPQQQRPEQVQEQQQTRREEQHQQGERADGAAGEPADADLCLSCSMGACPLPGRPEQGSPAGRRVLAAVLERQRQQHADLPPDAFVQAVRLAIRPGGCCASRAGFVGALMGALGGQVPAHWAAQVQGYGEVEAQAQRLVALRD